MTESCPPYTLAAFDFDGTITTGDSLQVFLRELSGWHGLIGGALQSSPWLCLAFLKIISRHSAKEQLLGAMLKGRSYADLDAAAKQFAEGTLESMVRPEMRERIRWHQNQGHRVVLVSASPSLYLRYWAARHGFETVLSTEMEWQNGVFTGNLAGRNCWGPEKVSRLAAWWGDHPPAVLHAYGDTRGDREMIARADHAWFRGVPVK
ncbi:HAD-IB family hydrolase [Burkholderiaceae bacterium DAT-1]|nr:HAD-IB family hydrolase [Burkholderiaceae bacterium DAT-1]